MRFRRSLTSTVALASMVGATSLVLMQAGAAGAPGPHLNAIRNVKVSANVAVRGVHYAKVTQVCGAPKPAHDACFALRRTAVHPAPGARLGANVIAVRPVSSSLKAGPAGGYTPSDLMQLYSYDRNGGTGQTVGIVDWWNDSTIRSDLNAYDKNYGFPHETKKSLRIVNQAGNASPLPSVNARKNNGSIETSLDVETVRAVCANCKILLVEAKSGAFANTNAAENTAVRLGADEISNSFGGPENPAKPAQDKAVANAYNHPGVAIQASTGDDGWYDWDYFNYAPLALKGFAPPYAAQSPSATNVPASVPSVTAVGGTTVGIFNGQRVETVWNENGLDDAAGLKNASPAGATGGGCSQIFAATQWQAAVANYSATGCGTARDAADISALADPATGFDIYDTDTTRHTPKWLTIGGTSLASPFVTGMWALAGGPQGVDYPSQTLYDNFASNPTVVHDVTQGGNALCDGDTPATCEAHLDKKLGLTNVSPNNLAYKIKGQKYYLGLHDCNWDGNGTLLTDVTQCVAAPGYDGPSGIGTPNGLAVFQP